MIPIILLKWDWVTCELDYQCLQFATYSWWITYIVYVVKNKTIK